MTLFGKLDVFRGTKQMVNPVVDLVGDITGRFVPVYPQSEKAGIETGNVRRWVKEALNRAGELARTTPDEDPRRGGPRHTHAGHAVDPRPR